MASELKLFTHRCRRCASKWSSTFRLPPRCIFCGADVVATRSARGK